MYVVDSGVHDTVHERGGRRMLGKRLGVGIIGATGLFGRYWYVGGLAQVPEAELVAVAARDATKLADLPVEATRYTEYHDLLADPRVELVVVCTPDVLHHTMVLDAAAAGKHVICEKPVALTLEQACAMEAALSKRGLYGFVNFNYRFVPVFQLLRHLVEAGTIGAVQMASVNFGLGNGLVPTDGDRPWRMLVSQAGPAGVLSDGGAHVLDLLCWLVAEPVSLVCQLHTLAPDRYRDGVVENADVCVLQGTLANGVPFRSYCSRIDDGPGKLVQVQLTGTTGMLALGSAFDQCVQLQRGQTVTAIPLAVVDEATAPLERIVQTSVPMLRQIVETILAGGDGGELPQMREGVRVQRLIDAALRSATEQRWVAPAALEP